MAARQHYSVSNAGPVNNTNSAAWVDAVALPEHEPDASSVEVYFWSVALQNATNATSDAKIRVRFGPTGFETTKASLNLESANVAEYPQLAGMFFHIEDVAPIGVICDVAIQPETNTNSINAKNGQIVALKLGVNDVAAESATRQTTTSTTPTSAVTANFTSDGGDFIMVGYGEFDANITTVPVYIRLTCDGVDTAELGARVGDNTNLTPGMMAWRFASVPSGARSSSFQFRAHSGVTAGITNARILVMRAADFDAVYGDQRTTDSSGAEASATALSFSQTVTANPHLLLGGWGTSAGTSNTDVRTEITEGGSPIAESIRRNYNTAAVRFHNNAFVSVRTPSAGSLTWALTRNQSGSATVAVGAGSGLFALDLGSSGGGPATYNESLTETGTVTQAATTVATFPNAQSEAATSAALQGVGLSMPVSRAEALTSAATQAAAQVHRPSLSENAASGESSATSATFAAAATEAVASADVGGTVATWPTARSETIAANDNAAAALIMPAVRAEDVAAGDDATGSVVGGAVTYDDVLSEAVTANESAAAASTLGAAVSETLIGAAAQAASAIWLSARSEAIAGSDLAQGAAQIGSALSEGAAGAVNEIVAGIFAGSTAENVAANDDGAEWANFSDSIVEGVGASDSYTGDGGDGVEPSDTRNVATALASRTANSNEPARDASTARASRNALTAAQNRTAVSIRLPR